MPKAGELGGAGLMPFMVPALEGWQVCGAPVYALGGMTSAVVRAEGLYQARQEWLDRNGYAGGWREVYEVAWQLADSELDRDIRDALDAAAKKAGGK